MAKKGPKKSIEKKEFDFNSFKKKLVPNVSVKDKPLSWIPLSEAFQESVGVPGIPKGYTSLFRGYANTGKSTGMYEGIASSQKLGILPVIIDTENNFSWEYAKSIGMEFDEIKDADGGVIDYSGFFIYFNTTSLKEKYALYHHQEGKTKTKPFRNRAVVEDIAMLVEELEETQIKGELDAELIFFWDSIGSIDCFKSVMSKSSNNQWNAGALSTSFNYMLNDSIPSSRKEGQSYTNTFVGIQKIWLDNENKVVKHKGGEAFYYGARFIVQFGGILTHGTSRLSATANGNTYFYGTKTRIRVIKNQINGIELEGEIASTPHGYINPEKKNNYTKKYRDFFLEKLNASSDTEITFSEDDPDESTLKEMYTSN